MAIFNKSTHARLAGHYDNVRCRIDAHTASLTDKKPKPVDKARRETRRRLEELKIMRESRDE